VTESSWPRRLRYGGYSVAVTIAFFVLLNIAVEALERHRWIETGRSDQVSQTVGPSGQVSQVLEERLWQEIEGRWRRTNYAFDIVPSRDFSVQKSDGFRAFVLGGSFAEGTPYPLDPAQDQGGGIASFVEAELRHRNPGRNIEVVNAAAAGRDSTWVRDVAAEVLNYDPDVLIVATCNNEGGPAPGWLNQYLRRQGGYRILAKLLRPGGGSAAERSWYTPQDPDTTALREQFASNIEAIVDQARAGGTQILLATLPINLRYEGFELGHVPDDLAAPKEQGPSRWPGPVGLSAPDFFADADPCFSGIVTYEAGFPAEAVALMRACAATSNGASAGSSPPEGIWDYIAIAEVAAGYPSEGALSRLRGRFGACISDAILRYHDGDPGGVAASLDGCDDVEEALRWKGLTLAETGDLTTARALLRQAVELRPRNRCRPSFNALLRTTAANAEHVQLVDLELKAEQASPGGLPGTELFIDYCHMNWRGYAEMSRAVLKVLFEVHPELNPGSAPLPEVDDLGRLLGMPDEAVLVQIARYNRLQKAAP